MDEECILSHRMNKTRTVTNIVPKINAMSCGLADKACWIKVTLPTQDSRPLKLKLYSAVEQAKYEKWANTCYVLASFSALKKKFASSTSHLGFNTCQFPVFHYPTDPTFHIWLKLQISKHLGKKANGRHLSTLILKGFLGGGRCGAVVPHYIKMQYLHSTFHANYFLLPWKITE